MFFCVGGILHKTIDWSVFMSMNANSQTLSPPPLTLRGTVCTKGGKKFETTIQGKKITASFTICPDENVLSLVKKILVDSHTNNATNTNNANFPHIENPG